MVLKAILDNLNDVPEHFHELYTEKNGKFEFTGVEGMKTQADIERLQSALAKERNDHKQTRDRFSVLGDRDLDEVVGLLDRIPELEAAAAGKVDETKMAELVEARLKTKLAPVEREKAGLATKVAELTGQIEQFQSRERTRAIHDEVRKAATSSKVLPEALEDALMLAERVFEVDEDGRVVAKEGVGCTPGVDPAVWLTELQNKRPHWWGPSQGGGSTGNNRGNGGGSNPWTAEHWNMTEQGRILNENRTRAEQLAKSAGTTIGGPRPAMRK
jgi:hypothetical protein